jgi:YbgC/YbaW family acyl-CoA thioester hydrolase
MTSEFRTRRRIRFAETDMAGIVHFSNYFRFMEDAEHEFFRSLGFSIHTRIDGKLIGWPRVRAECAYHAPLAYDETVDIHLVVRKKTKKTITCEYEFTKQGTGTVAHGSMTVICVSMDPDGKMSSVPIPKCIDDMVEVAP